jgi:fengycin family lipopeptide synthetase D
MGGSLSRIKSQPMEKIDKKNFADILALTPVQEGMLFHYLKDPGSDLYFEQLCLEITGTIDFLQFERAWNRVIETNEMLRTVFRWEQVEHPVQIILKQHHLCPGYDDFSDRDARERKRLLGEVKTRSRKNICNLAEIPFGIHLCKTGDRRYEMIISHHHILYDGWSNGIILKEFFMAYHALCKGEGSIKPPVKTPFKEFIKYVHSQDRKIQEQFWGEYLNGIDTPTALTIKKRRGEVKCLESVSLILAKDIKDKLDVFVNNNRVTLAPVFYTAWGILLQKYCGCDDVIFGTTVSGRSAEVKGIEEMVGLFINTIPMRVHSAPGVKIIDVLTGIENLLREREKFESTSLVDIGSYSPAAGMGSLFDTIVAVENYPLDSRLVPEDSWLSIHSYSIIEMTHYDLTVGIMPFNEIEIKFSFKQELFDKETIENLAAHFKGIVRNIIENSESVLFQLEIISIEEKNRILYEFNNTAAEYPGDKTLYGLFEEQADRIPDHIALGGPGARNCKGAFLKNRPLDPQKTFYYLTYRELNERSGRLAGWLIEKGVLGDNIVGIRLERSVEMIIGILGILKSGAAYLPLNPEQPEARTHFMLKDSGAKLLVTTGTLAKPLESSTYPPIFLPAYLQNSSNLAYIIYTSGSTGWPKGVAVEHSQVVNFVFHMYNQYDKDVGVHDRCLGVTNIMFDVSVWECFLPLTFGARLVILPEQERFDVFALVAAIGKEQITLIYLPPALLEDVCELLKKQNRWISLNKMLVGVEPIRDEVLEGYMQLKPGMKIINGYGPTETTICATSYNYLSHEPLGDIVPIGIPLSNLQVILYDAAAHIIPQGIPGEICISGGGVSRGYINNPELTSDKFKIKEAHKLHELTRIKVDLNKKLLRGDARKAQSAERHAPCAMRLPPGRRRQRLYRTGDLARWLKDGNIEFLGRIDNQVKIRGFRIEPGEIEKHLLEHREVKGALVTAREYENGDKYLCAYVVPQPGCSPHLFNTLKEYLSGRLPDYMVPAYFVMLDRIPLNPNGKVDLKALPGPEITLEENLVKPGSEIEVKLAATWSEVLGIDHNKIGIDSDFFRLGGHSLKAMTLLLKIHKTFNVKVPIDTLFAAPTVRGLAQYIKGAKQYLYTPIKEVEKKEYYPLSTAQKRLYITCHAESEGVGYNVQNLVEIDGPLSRQRVEKTFNKLIARHESLRTSFHVLDDEPVQRVHDRVEFAIEYYQVKVDAKFEEEWSPLLEGTRGLAPWPGEHAARSLKPAAALISSFIRPFDLSKVPLLRVGLIKLLHTPAALHGQPPGILPTSPALRSHPSREGSSILIIDMHHIIADAFSMGLFVHQFKALYREEMLPALKIQYKEYVLWQAELTGNPQDRETLRCQENYWLKELEGEVPLLNLPLDYPRPTFEKYEGAIVYFELDQEKTTLLKNIALEQEVTVFMLLLAAFNVLLSKICDQEDILVGTPVAGRKHADLQQVIGLFVNMLALKNQPSGSKTFSSFLTEIKKKTLAAYENQDYPYEELVDRLSIKRNPGRNPLFDVILVWEDLDMELGKLENTGIGEDKLKLKLLKYDKINAPFDLVLNATETNEKMSFFINYRTSIFKRETIEQIIGSFKEIISSVLEEPDIKLEDIAVSYNLLEAKPACLPEDQDNFGF